jgi:hypothetical protein
MVQQAVMNRSCCHKTALCKTEGPHLHIPLHSTCWLSAQQLRASLYACTKHQFPAVKQGHAYQCADRVNCRNTKQYNQIKLNIRGSRGEWCIILGQGTRGLSVLRPK